MKEQLKKVLCSIGIMILVFTITAIPTVLASNSDINITTDSVQIVSATQNLSKNPEKSEVVVSDTQTENTDVIEEAAQTQEINENNKPEENVENINESEKMDIVIKPADDEFQYREYIPLAYDIQLYAYNQCKDKNIRYELFLALMKAESSFNPKAASGCHAGLGQLNAKYHTSLAERLCNSTDLFDPYVNITVATEIIGGYLDIYNGDEHKALISYNAGGGGAKKLFEKGITSTKYSNKIISSSENI